MNKRLIETVVTWAIVMLLVPSVLVAQTAVGKFHGKITDVDTGEPLIGANVLIEDTQVGAATDINGEYFILNVAPGTYTVRVSYVGYQPQVIHGVRIVAGITQDLDVRLKSTAVEVGEIVITAERPLFESKATNTVKVYDTKEIAQLPVRGVQRAVSILAGVVSAEGSGGVDGNARINVRGGRGNEVLYIIDGVPQNLALGESETFNFSTNNAQVSDNAIEQVAFQVGGYEAKYGQAQSGIVNITTRSGGPKYNVFGEVVSSEFTDDFGYNLYSLNMSGPIIPGNLKHTAFLSGERGWFLDSSPSAVGVHIPSIGYSSKTLPNNSSGVWRFSGRTFHNLDLFTVRLSANLNERKGNDYVHLYAKNNANHNPRFEQLNQSYGARLSKDFSATTFLNLNVGFRQFDNAYGDGQWFKNFAAYGDTSLNFELLELQRRRSEQAGRAVVLQGFRPGRDSIGVFFDRGRQFLFYSQAKEAVVTLDFDFFSQIQNHLVEFGAGLWTHEIRYIHFNPTPMAVNKHLPVDSLFYLRNPIAYGYWLGDDWKIRETGDKEREPRTGSNIGPKKPVIAYGYVQDRFELEDLVLNLGVRFDYLDSKADILRDETLPYAFGDPNRYDDEDFVRAPKQFNVSPRVGMGFPVTPTTVFHAQWGKFIQNPQLIDVYTTPFDLSDLISDQNLGVNTGNVNPEKTTQYEVGFRQILGNNDAAVNVTAFYKNTENLTNTTTRFFRRREGGQVLRYYGPSNYDFGTIRGLAFTLDIRKISYFWASFNYTLSYAEGTGSSTTSSLIATFRNDGGEVPIVITPLDFDQRHTGNVSVGFVTGQGELGVFENISLNVLASFNSGRPYTPLYQQDLLAGSSNYGDTKGYVNSKYGPGRFLVNLKLEKTFNLDRLSISPYLWVENVFDAVNPVEVYRTTGSPYTTEWLETAEGQAAAESSPVPEFFRSDFRAYEKTPSNFGVPRQIRLGLKVNFTE